MVDSIWPVITIYSNDKKFTDVKGAFCRLVDPEDKEFCRINLSDNYDNISNGNIMCSIKRYTTGAWALKARGYYTYNTRTYK
jgi:stress response protein SCP2